MFTIYHSNQLELLKSLTAELIIREPQKKVFAPEIILVQSQGMAQWLQIELANELAIVANFDFPFPTPFIWQLYHTALPHLPSQTSFEQGAMVWKLLALLPTVIEQPVFIPLRKYLQDQDNNRKYYQLAVRLAALFDQYLIHRPDWIMAWQQGEMIAELGPEQIWQSALWRALIEYTAQLGQPIDHTASVYHQFMAQLQRPHLSAALRDRLPQRLFIFGIVSLPPLYLQSLYALGQHIDVHFMFNNPCRWYWGDIPDQRYLNQLSQAYWLSRDKQITYAKFNADSYLTTSLPATYSEHANPLLASWGKLGRDNLFLLQELASKYDIEAFVDNGDEQLLSVVKQDILTLTNRAVVGRSLEEFSNSQGKKGIAVSDESITLHACHSEQREVEVLYDYLLAQLSEDPALELRDIVIMVADIDRYVPYIKSVFTSVPSARYLPYSISDQRAANSDPLIQAFFTLLQLPQNRFTTENLFELLEVPALASQFGIDEAQLALLRKWVVESGIRWGLDDESLQSLDIDNEDRHSWRFGLTRMLLGYMMSGEAGSWQQIYPYDGAKGLEAELLGRLADFLQALTHWRAILTQDQPVATWRQLGPALLDTFFAISEHSESLLLLLNQHWSDLIDIAEGSGYQSLLAVQILHDALQIELDNAYLSHRFLAGKLNFCTMMPMRAIPFKMVCLLGMNEGSFPRTQLTLGFDLITHHPRKGDRSRRHDDRYLFLEAVLSAQKQLYISYIGRSIQDNSERYPSVLVEELLDYLQQRFVLYGDEALTIDESANKIRQHLIYQHPRMPFSPLNYIATRYQSYADEWLPAAMKQGQVKAFLSPLPHQAVSQLTIEQLKRFYVHTIRTFMQQRLGIYRSYQDDSLPEAENFILQGIPRYQFNEALLTQLLKTGSGESVYEYGRTSGELPYGAYGALCYQQQEHDVRLLAERIWDRATTPIAAQEVNLHLMVNNQAISLEGWLTHQQPEGIFRWRASKVGIRDGVALWIDHLLYCLLHPDNQQVTSQLIGLANSQWQFSAIAADKARTILTRLVQGYLTGLNQPLLLPLKSAWSWLEAAYYEETQTISTDPLVLEKAQTKLISAWQGGFNQASEYDEYYRQLYPVLTDAVITQITDAAQQYLLPLSHYYQRR